MFRILVGCLAFCLAPATFAQVIKLGNPSDEVGVSCDPSSTFIEVDLTPGFDIIVRNCVDAAVDVALVMAYSTPPNSVPPGNPSSAGHFGMEQGILSFAAKNLEVTWPIVNIPSTGTGRIVTVDVHVTAFSASPPATGKPADRQLGLPLQVQRSSGAGPSEIVSRSEVATLLQQDILLRNYVSPQGWGEYGLTEGGVAGVDNRGRLSMRGSLLGKIICSRKTGEADNCTSEDSVRKGSLSFNLAPEGSASFLVAKPQPLINESFFPVCCDPNTDSTTPARAIMQCSRVAISQITIDGVDKTITPAFVSRWFMDVENSRIQTTPVNNLDFDCDSFTALDPGSFTGSAGALFIKDDDNDGIADVCDFMTGSTTTESGGSPAQMKRRLRRLNFDGTAFDEMEPDNLSLSGVDVIEVAGQSASIQGTTNTRVDFTLPTPLPPGNAQVRVVDTGVFDRISTHDIQVVRTAYVPVTGSDGLHPFDEISGVFIDTDPSFNESVPNLPTGGLTTAVLFTSEAENENKELIVSSATDLFLYDMELVPPAFTKNVPMGVDPTDVRKLFIEDKGRFGFVLHDDGQIGAVQVQRFPNQGNPAPIDLADRLATFPSIASVMGRAAGLTASEIPFQGSGQAPKPRFALYVAWSCLGCAPTTTTACTDPIVLAQLDDGQQPLLAEVSVPPALPVAIKTPAPWHPGGGPFATSLLSTMLWQDCFPGTCSFYVLPGEGGEGGGGGSSNVDRNVWLSVRVVEANLDTEDPLLGAPGPSPSFWTPVCDKDILLASESVAATSPLWEQLGVTLSPDKNRLYVVDPQDDMLVILDPRDITMMGMPISTGKHPFDVAAMVVPDQAGADVERVYVVNRGEIGTPNDDELTVINPVSGIALPPIDLNLEFPNLSDLSIERITASQSTSFLFLVSKDNDKFFILDASINGDSPIGINEFGVGPTPGRVAVPVVVP